ncbi:MAG: type I 3-dehydroquinate dehydratase [Clostridia bacterium]|nr:type I 3-dehydroquinate dehydratase [Clostridia bacterium]
MKKTFLCAEKPLLTVMIQTPSAEYAIDTVKKALQEGAEAFGLQTCRLEDQSPETYGRIFSAMGEKPCYVTHYRHGFNQGKNDEQLADGLLTLAKSGATLCDVMGDLFDPQPDELAVDPKAIEKQKELIDALHQAGAEVLISSHIYKFTPAERVLEMALEHQRRGADIAKIVTGAETMEQQIENLRIIDLLKRELKIPFLFLAGGECKLLRRVAPIIGDCMYLCVYEHNELSTKYQPLLEDVKTIRELLL